MAILKDILYKVSLVSTSGDMGRVVDHIAFDSRKVKEGTLFIAVKGTQVDGHDFILQAVNAGAAAVVCEILPEEVTDSVTYVAVKNSAGALGLIASNFYDNPSTKLKLVGVTGTNGKTTIATLLFNLFRSLGHSAGLLSTVVNRINDDQIQASHTTPDAIQLNEMLDSMARKGCKYVFMEVSSHAIQQERVAGQRFAGAIFTNISHDHLDYHKTFDAYISAKKKLFDELSSEAFALVNVDDKRGRVMLQNTKAGKNTYALRSVADFKGKLISNTLQGLEMEIDNKNVWFRLIGDFNAYNLLAAYGTAVLLEEDPDKVLTGLSLLDGAPGRFEQVVSDANVTAIVDYAHTPDALQNVLETIAELRTGNEQVITVVGCGGNRDKGKRPLMASIACKLSDKVVFTSDNPRDEDPAEIIRDMQAGVGPADYKKTVVLADREEAIKTACLLANDNDIILVAGKGHEKYQEIKGVKHPFDDKEVLGRMLNLFAN
ncbi:UDP-N-acetylmuramoylalanyl-D-glutamate--2,6-diaminopimelate ligase [Fulvivirga imtechensis AK7]|uniref:UDP-N-acetylmuramoyl-L-alanyl-D-glutamate--2,6-diaminopimelate ligase n=1 Tax=Fulvivirga imtechensis AK7 TaxID=1237149 RepID=L8JSN7_9BACT|nr:UDP-N-acetylmuramoyl-L-alanyl-D-glutamate--2,6-diaminopimelate ligase [Fulvivirga imtechensis]ELR71860.1 UDP-N-acetylmuramoylalanyl-D-glutamate--2,6-diaminopimelate ligase [Fulvivirga imtechensis AK7]